MSRAHLRLILVPATVGVSLPAEASDGRLRLVGVPIEQVLYGIALALIAAIAYHLWQSQRRARADAIVDERTRIAR